MINSASSTSIDPTSQVGNILITEWGAASTTNLDYIELRNFSTSLVTIDSSLSILLGASFGTTITLTKYGTGDDPASYAAFTSLSLAAGEVIMIVESDITTANIQAIGVPTGIKIFLSDQTKLIGSNKKLHENPAKLKSGVHEWSQTPWPWTAGTSTYSLLKGTFTFGVDSTQDATQWNNGSKSSSTPGVWP